jgi:hypothetical protein
VVLRYKAWVCCRSLAGIARSNLDEDVVRSQIQVSARGRSLVQRSPTECLCYWVWSRATVTLPTQNVFVDKVKTNKQTNTKINNHNFKFCCNYLTVFNMTLLCRCVYDTLAFPARGTRSCFNFLVNVYVLARTEYSVQWNYPLDDLWNSLTSPPREIKKVFTTVCPNGITDFSNAIASPTLLVRMQSHFASFLSVYGTN